MGNRSILFVEDDPFFLDAIGQFLEDQGYRVRRAANGLEALDAVRDEVPDLILLDLILPKINGGRVCRYLREDPRFRHIPIVVFSALGAPDIARMPDVSADAYVAKGPLQVVAKNMLAALQRLGTHSDAGRREEAVFGYEGFRPRRLVSEVLAMRSLSDLLLQNMSEGVLNADDQDRIFYVNPTALAMLGRAEQDVIGTKLWEAFGSAHMEAMQRAAQRSRLDATLKRQELALRLNGRSLKASFVSVRENEEYGGLLLLLEDIGDFRQIREA